MKNKFLSLEWFKSTAERAIEKVIASKLENLIEQEEQEEQNDVPECLPKEKPYLAIKLVNDTLTIVLKDGSIVSKPGATEENFLSAKSAVTTEDLFNIITTSEVLKERKEAEEVASRIINIQNGISTLAILPDFVVEGNTVYLNGTSRSLPQLLVEKFAEVVERVSKEPSTEVFHVQLNKDEEYLSLKRFFMWCCLNPRAEVANELYRFLSENSFRITKQGFFVALRNVVTLHGSPELVHFISNSYNKVKAVWKKNPNDYTVFLENGEYKLVHEDKLTKIETHTSTTCVACNGDGGFEDCEGDWIECEVCNGSGEEEEYTYEEEWPVDHGEKIGKLTELYLDLPNREENRFTDDWTKTFDIRIGQVTSMPTEDCNWSTQDCAAAGLKYVASL
jgi:hypothetical protein